MLSPNSTPPFEPEVAICPSGTHPNSRQNETSESRSRQSRTVEPQAPELNILPEYRHKILAEI